MRQSGGNRAKLAKCCEGNGKRVANQDAGTLRPGGEDRTGFHKKSGRVKVETRAHYT